MYVINNTAATTRILNINLKYVEVVFFFFALPLLVVTFVCLVLPVTNKRWFFKIWLLLELNNYHT